MKTICTASYEKKMFKRFRSKVLYSTASNIIITIFNVKPFTYSIIEIERPP